LQDLAPSGSTLAWEGAMLEIGNGRLNENSGRRREISPAELAAVVVGVIVVLALVW
jgi:hypothetical protein